MRISDLRSDVLSSDLPCGNWKIAMNSVFVRPDVQAFLDYVNTARPAKHFELGPEKARTIMRDMRVLADVPVGELAVEQDLHCKSEEHTSELQSLMRISYAVFCLKKKK